MNLLPNEHDLLADAAMERAMADALISDLRARIAELEAELARWRRNYPTSAAWEHALLLKEATDDTES